MPDVYLLTEGPEGTVAVPHLTLTFLPTGLRLDKADGEPVWDSSWRQLEEMTPVERSVLPDGRAGVVMEVVERGRQRHRYHRFVLTTDDPAATEASVRGRAAAHGLRTTTPKRAISRTVTLAIVVIGLATLTALLLSAAHVIHF